MRLPWYCKNVKVTNKESELFLEFSLSKTWVAFQRIKSVFIILKRKTWH